MRFPAPVNMNKSVHEFLWTSNSVWFCNFNEYSNNITGHKIIGANNLKFTGATELASKQIWGETNMLLNLSYPTEIQKTGFFKATLDYMTGYPTPFYTHRFINNIPPSFDEKVHINIWLSSNLPDGYVGQKYEVIISNFEFIPINQIGPRLEILNVGNNSLTLRLNSQGN
jgi:hypothetical protein